MVTHSDYVVGVCQVRYQRLWYNCEEPEATPKYALPSTRLKLLIMIPSAALERPLSLSRCRELREFELCPSGLPLTELDHIPSITSPTMEKLILTRSAAFRFLADDPYWKQLDDILVRLVGRSEHGLRLKVEFQGFARREAGPRKVLADVCYKGPGGGF
jgi:hypothetical protein